MTLQDKDKLGELDEKILRRLRISILGLERLNLKTKKYKEYQMNREIKKIIEREVL